jgi:hypothetical protein
MFCLDIVLLKNVLIFIACVKISVANEIGGWYVISHFLSSSHFPLNTFVPRRLL